jgi:hypothetical protein
MARTAEETEIANIFTIVWGRRQRPFRFDDVEAYFEVHLVAVFDECFPTS